MTDFEELQKKIDDSGMTMVAIAEKTGILKATLYNRFKGVGEFTATEITALTAVLHLSRAEREKIFFARGFNEIKPEEVTV